MARMRSVLARLSTFTLSVISFSTLPLQLHYAHSISQSSNPLTLLIDRQLRTASNRSDPQEQSIATLYQGIRVHRFARHP
jgi:hypothetical protein